MNEPSASEGILRVFTSWRRWMRAQRALRGSVMGFLAAGYAALITAFFLLNEGRLVQAQYFWLLATAGIAGAALGGVTAYLWPLRPGRASRQLDHSLNLMDRLSTALEIMGRSLRPAQPLERLQLDDTFRALQDVHPREGMRWRPGSLEIAAGLALILAAVGFLAAGQPAMRRAAERQAFDALVEAETKGIESMISEIEAHPGIDPETHAALLEDLQQARLELAQAGSPEEAVAAVEKALSELRSAETIGAREILTRLAASAEPALEPPPGSPLAALDEALASGDLPRASETLAGLDPAGLTDQERQALIEQFEASSQAIAAQAPDLAEALDRAADALRSGNPVQAEASLQALAEQLEVLESSLAAEVLAEELGEQLAASQGRLIEAGSGDERTAGTLDAGDPSGSADGGGQSSGTAQEGSQQGGGSGLGPTDGGLTEAGDAPASPILPGVQPGDGGLREYEGIFAPGYAPGSGGDPLQLPGGSPTGSPGGLQGEAGLSAAEGLAQVPYVEVYPQYLETYLQAIETGAIPPHLRDVIRAYFGALEP